MLKNDTSASGKMKATGVVFSSNDLLYEAKIKPSGEVIVAGGALSTPQILELSGKRRTLFVCRWIHHWFELGIGNPNILSKHGIEIKVDLPGVGENLIVSISLSQPENQ